MRLGGALALGPAVMAEPGRGLGGPPQNGKGRGNGNKGGGLRRRGGNGPHDIDHQAIQTLLQNRDQIQRKVENLPDGVRTLTETDNKELRPILIAHVEAMYDRLEEGRPIHMRDPLFRSLFAHAKEIKLIAKPTKKGLVVIETSENPKVVKLIQAHAQAVTLFLKNGPAEVRRNHPVPD